MLVIIKFSHKSGVTLSQFLHWADALILPLQKSFINARLINYFHIKLLNWIMSLFICTTDVFKIIAQLYNAIILMTAGPCETYCIHKQHDLYDGKFKVKCIVTLLNSVGIIFAEALTEILPLPKI